MLEAKRTANTNRSRRWIITIGVFIIVQAIFIAIDGTSLVPNLNDSNNFLVNIERWILDSKLLTEWFAPYSFPLFNLFLIIHVIAILIQAVKDIVSTMISKK